MQPDMPALPPHCRVSGVTRSLLVLAFLETSSRRLNKQLGRAETLDVRNQADSPSPRPDFRCANYCVLSVVVALDENVRANFVNHLKRSAFIENRHGIDRGKCRKHSSAVVLADYRPGRPFQPLDRISAVDGNNQPVALLASAFKQVDMTYVEQIKTAIRKDDPLPYRPPRSYPSE